MNTIRLRDQVLAQELAARIEAIRTLDMAWARTQATLAIIGTGHPPPDDDVLLAGLHKARYDCVQVEDILRHESARWLRERGMQARGRPLEPEGELPR